MAAEPQTDTDLLPPIHHLTKDEARELFDRAARYYLQMTGKEFLEAWDAGEFKDKVDGPDHVNIMSVVMLIPLGR